MWCILHFLTWIFLEVYVNLAFRYLQRNFEVQNRYLAWFHSVKNLRSSSRNVFSAQNPFFQRFKSQIISFKVDNVVTFDDDQLIAIQLHAIAIQCTCPNYALSKFSKITDLKST